MKTRQSGFTLIEMLVVIAIIGILAGALFFSITSFTKSSQKARANELVSNAKTALAGLYLRENRWPSAFLTALNSGNSRFGNYYVMGEDVAKVLAQYNVLSVDYTGGSLHGKDRCGIVDPWAGDVLERAPADKKAGALLEYAVPSGGKVKDHRLYFAVDVDGDGFVDRSEGAPVDKIREKAIVWCAGQDGKLGTDGSKDASDNVYSWKSGQELKKGK